MMFRSASYFVLMLLAIGFSFPLASETSSAQSDGSNSFERGRGRDRGGWGRGGWGGGRGGWGRGNGDLGGSRWGRGGGGDWGNWRGRGGERGGRRGNRKMSAEETKKQRKRYSDYYNGRIDALDTNKNGRLDPAEQNGEFKKLITHFGMDPKKSASIAGLKTRIRTSDLTKINSSGWGRSSSQPESETSEYGIPGFSEYGESDGEGIPGFGVMDEEPNMILGFGDSEHPVLKDKRPLTVRFTKEAIEEGRRTIKTYDRNKNGRLDPAEIKLVPWRNPGYKESDLDKNGFLTEVEMIHRSDLRFKQRSKYRNGRRSNNQPSSSKNPSSSKKDKKSRTNNKKKKPTRGKTKKKSKYERQQEDIKWVKGVFARYDKDQNGSWSQKEFGKIRMKPGDGTFKGSDKNKDGKITLKEVLPLYLDDVDADSVSSSASSDANTPKVTWAPLLKEVDSKKKTLPYEMRSRDKNKNNQIEMHEYTTKWTAQKLKEFKKKDTSGDGILTIDELVTSSSSSRSSRRSSRSSSRSKSSSSSSGSNNLIKSSKPIRLYGGEG